MCERYIDQLPLAYPQLGTCSPATQECALTGTQTCDLSVHRPALNPLLYTSQGQLTSTKGTKAVQMVLEQLDSHVDKKEISFQLSTSIIYFQSNAYLQRVVTVVSPPTIFRIF